MSNQDSIVATQNMLIDGMWTWVDNIMFDIINTIEAGEYEGAVMLAEAAQAICRAVLEARIALIEGAMACE